MSKDKTKGINGKAFVAALEECLNAKAIFELLQTTMDKDTLKDRLLHVNDNELINALHAQKAKCNIKLGYRTFHQDCLDMAADRYHTVTKKSPKFFKAELNKFMTGKEKGESARAPINPMIAARQRYDLSL